ncbi:MAG: outer membrane lipoprotein carrier protein LolA [Muribaculaceae bacterium]
MIRIIILWILSMFAFWGVHAQSATDVLNKVIAAYKISGGISANYVVTSSQGSASGKIEMQGNKFRITSPELMCWYNGTTQWAYSAATGEVNITTPTVEEMQMSNPYVALTSMKQKCHIYRAFTQVSGFYTIKLVPKLKSSGIKQILLYVVNGSDNISKAYFEMSDGNSYTTKITNYKNVKLSDSVFTFDKKSVPAGTEVVDLR